MPKFFQQVKLLHHLRFKEKIREYSVLQQQWHEPPAKNKLVISRELVMVGTIQQKSMCAVRKCGALASLVHAL